MVQFVSTVSQYMYSHNKVSPVAPAHFHQQKCNKMKCKNATWHMNLCADTSAHQDLCLLQKSVICEHQIWSYSEAHSIYYDSNHINLLHEWANEIKKINVTQKWLISISTRTNLLLTNKDNPWFVLLQINLSFLTTKNAMFWMLIIMWSHLIDAVSNCLSLSLTVCTPLIFSCLFLAYCMILLAQHLPQGLPNEALSV